MHGRYATTLAAFGLALVGCEVECPPGSISYEKRCLSPDQIDGGITDGGIPGDGSIANDAGGGSAQLTNLEVSAGELDPPFDPAVRSYRVRLPTWITVLSVVATTVGDAVVTINGSEALSGSWSNPIGLEASTNTVVDLEGADGAASYSISVSRHEPVAADLAFDSVIDDLAISGDGATLFVGTPFNNGDTANPRGESRPGSGAIFVFQRNGERWNQAAYLKAPGTASPQYLGHHVALAKDGGVLAVNAYRATTETGGPSTSSAVHIFRSVGGIWNRTELIHRPTLQVDEEIVGISIADDGNRLAVVASLASAPRTIVLRWTGSRWEAETEIDNRAWINGSGTMVTVWDETLVRFEEREGLQWTRSTVAPIPAPDVSVIDFKVAMSSDSNLVVNGLPAFESHSGRVSLYHRENNEWKVNTILNDSWTEGRFGDSVGLTNNSLTVVTAAPGAARQEAYNWTGESRTTAESIQIGTPTVPPRNTRSAIAVSANGTAMASRSSLTTIRVRHLPD